MTLRKYRRTRQLQGRFKKKRIGKQVNAIIFSPAQEAQSKYSSAVVVLNVKAVDLLQA